MVENKIVPVHRKLSSSEVEALLEKYNLNSKIKLPQISIKDPALASLDVELGDVIEIQRESFAGKSSYYRVIVE